MKDDLPIGQATDFLNVSHLHLLDLLKTGTLQIRLVGSERRVRVVDLARYKEQVDTNAKRRSMN